MWYAIVIVAIALFIAGTRANKETVSVNRAATFVTRAAQDVPHWAISIHAHLKLKRIQPQFSDLAGIPEAYWASVSVFLARVNKVFEAEAALSWTYPMLEHHLSDICTGIKFNTDDAFAARLRYACLTTLMQRDNGTPDPEQLKAHFTKELHRSQIVFFSNKKVYTDVEWKRCGWFLVAMQRNQSDKRSASLDR